tara:strand:+ start:7787 stop:8167 length:381 start_codon:yes stop_codon:yes gene_type:complete
MKNTFKTLLTLLVLSTLFTSCTQESTPTPTPATIDIRDAAEGTFQSDFAPIRLVFVKDPDSVGQMLVLDYQTNEVNAVMFIIKETRDGFTYGFENDVMTGRYNKIEDTHTLLEPNGTEWFFPRLDE